MKNIEKIKKIAISLIVLVLAGFVSWVQKEPKATVVNTLTLGETTTINLIANPSVEVVSSINDKLPEGWYQDSYGRNQVIFSYPVSGYQSEKAIKVELKSRSTGDAKWVFQDISVVSDKEYIFSDYYISNIKSYLVVRVKLKNNRYAYFDIATLNPATDWSLATVSFKVPKNAVSLTVYHLIKNVGSLTTDNFSLTLNDQPSPTPTFKPTLTPTPIPISSPTPTPTSTPIPNPTSTPTPNPTTIPTPLPTVPPQPTPTPITSQNLIANPDFEINSNSTPQSWFQGNWGTNTAIFTYPVADASGGKAAKVEITSYKDGDAKWYFQDVAVEQDATYLFSDSYQSNVVSHLIVRYKPVGSEQYTYFYVAQINPSISWATTGENAFTIPTGVESVTIFHLINQVGFLIIDNASLKKAPEQTRFNQGLVSLSFDDGWVSVFTNGLPILNAAGFKSTQYIITNMITDGNSEYVSVAQVLEMQAQGHEIAAHSRTHPHLIQLTESQAQAEIAGSRADLLAIGATPVGSFAYPYGEYNSLTESLVKAAGFSSARTVDDGFNFKNTNPYFLKTKSIESGITVEQVKSWIHTAIQEKSWLIIVFHQVDTSGSDYSITPANLQAIVDYLKQNNVSVVTISQGLQQMSH